MLHHITALALIQAAPPPAAPKPSDALPADWVAIPDDEILIFTLANGRTVTIRLAARYTPAHVANIRALARARWWDGETVYRVQDNYVVQWGDATEKKALPTGVRRQSSRRIPLAALRRGDTDDAQRSLFDRRGAQPRRLAARDQRQGRRGSRTATAWSASRATWRRRPGAAATCTR
jgi:hypothetical protein